MSPDKAKPTAKDVNHRPSPGRLEQAHVALEESVATVRTSGGRAADFMPLGRRFSSNGSRVASTLMMQRTVGNQSVARLIQRKGAYPADIVKQLKALDPSGVAPAAAQVMGAVRDLSIFITGCQNEAMFEGGPNKHEWWNLWGAIGTSEKQLKAEGLLDMAAKASEFMTALTELGTGITDIAGKVQAWTSSLPDVEPAETAAGELAEKLEHVTQVLTWVNAFIHAANTIGQAMAASHALAEFQHNPTSKTAEEWALGVGNVFEGLGDTIGAIPGFPIAIYWKSIMKAPKVLIMYFISAQHTYYDRIDAETKDNGTGKGKVLKPGTSENDPVNQ